MSELAGHALVPADELAVGEEGCAKTLGDGEEYGVADAVKMAEPELGQEAGICVIFELDRDAEAIVEHLADGEIVPAQVWGEEQAVGGWVDAAGKADPGPLEGEVGVTPAKGEQRVGKGGNTFFGSLREIDGLAGEDVAVEVDGGEGGAAGVGVAASIQPRIWTVRPSGGCWTELIGAGPNEAT